LQTHVKRRIFRESGPVPAWPLRSRTNASLAKDWTLSPKKIHAWNGRGFHKWGYPNSWIVYNGKSLQKWVTWGYQHFRNLYIWLRRHVWKCTSTGHLPVSAVSRQFFLLRIEVYFYCKRTLPCCSRALAWCCQSASNHILGQAQRTSAERDHPFAHFYHHLIQNMGLSENRECHKLAVFQTIPTIGKR